MHKYADLNKNRRTTRLEGNLVVANRKRSAKAGKVNRSPQLILWIVIVVMFTVSGLYIRYQAIYVEDSVFRDAYLLVNEHFLSKKPLPDPNLLTSNPATANSTISPTTHGENPPVASATKPSATATSTTHLSTQPNPNAAPQASLALPLPPPPVGQSPVPETSVTTPQNRAGVIPTTATRAPTAPTAQNTDQAVQVNPTVSPDPTGVVNPSLPQYPQSQAQPLTQPLAQPLAQGYASPSPAAGQSASGGIGGNLSTTTPVISKKREVFSYYHPILNSKSTKVGFFVVNKETEYSDDRLYQALFNNLVAFKSSNPKVRNFFDPQTRLNNAWVENDTLLLDFNSAFENSKYGYLGLEIKVQQILWTFFNFKSDSVNKISYISFLIGGSRKDVIGGDGKALKPFYSRKDLGSIITL